MPPPSSAPPKPEAGAKTWTVRTLLGWTQQRFDEVGIDAPRVDAEYLLAFALECSRMSLYVEHDKVVNTAERARFRELVRRRLAREPVAYIEGKRGFHALDLELHVDRRVLIPRPETEHLVDWVLDEIDPTGTVLDIGTGSGAIALALARARPELEVVACDVSEGAVEVARANAERLELAVEVLHSDLLASVPRPEGGWATIVSNPPYIREPDWRELAPEVQQFEPRLALVGGEDGLDVIRRLLVEAVDALASGGRLYLEVGYDQGESVPALLAEHGLVEIEVRKDFASHPRIVRGRRA